MKKIPLIFILLFLISACSSNKESASVIFCMDTVMDIKVYGEKSGDAVSEIESELNRLEKLFDRKYDGSDICTIKSGKIHAETEEIIKKALDISLKTDGAFDITIAPLMDLWGFYDKEYTIPGENEIKNALKSVSYRNIFFDEKGINIMNNAAVDLGGIAKGYASDKTVDILEKHGIKSAIVNLGGNVYAHGMRPNGKMWTVAVANPFDKEKNAVTVNVSDKAVVTSGAYQRCFEADGKKYHHIIDPKTGFPSESGIQSVTVIDADGTEADALSTAFFVMGKDRTADFLADNPGIDAVVITEEKKIYYTSGLEGCISNESDMEILCIND